ncbi:MAG: tyramine oxidase, partial [Ignavibacteriae bacterium]
VLGADVPLESRTFPLAAITSTGEASMLPDVVAVYERDAGMFLRHRDPTSFKVTAQRGRELVITHTATIGNYDYAISYIFCLDGAIRVEARLSGILLVQGTKATTGMLIANNLAAPFHQHFFNFRLDLDVNGTANSIHELDVWSPPTPSNENPRGNTMMLDDYEYKFEQAARASVDTRKSRTWMIASTERTNVNGQPSSDMLMPGGNAFPYIVSLALPRTRARFVDHHLWTTVHHADELYAAGPYPNQNAGGEGLPQYITNNEALHGRDLVLWYTMGITHVTRPEDWPIMPVHVAGFALLPMNYR